MTGSKRFNNLIIMIMAAAVGLLIWGVSFSNIVKTPVFEKTINGADLERDPEQNNYPIQDLSLDKGVYRIRIRYETTANGRVEVGSEINSHNTLMADEPVLYPEEKEVSFLVWVNKKIGAGRIILWGGDGELRVDSVEIMTDAVSKRYGTACLSLLILGAWALIVLFLKRESFRKYYPEIAGIVFITVFASLGLFVRYLNPGHDLNFHLVRIEGVKEAILSGNIPSRVQTNWSYGWGYAVSAMYGDVTLVLSAVMRILGFTVQASYKTFVFAVNLATALSAFFCFREMCRENRFLPVAAAFLYTCSPYRFCNIYIRGAVGEYTGMIFLPMIALGFYYAFCQKTSKEDYGKRLLVPVLGFTGLLQTHILSCQMVLLFMVLLCAVEWKKVITKPVFLYLSKIGASAVFVNLWFLVPFLAFRKEPLIVNSANHLPEDYQLYGLSVAELFAQKASGSMTYSWAQFTGLSERMGMAPGNAFFIAVICYVLLRSRGGKEKKLKGANIMLIFALIAVFLSTSLFPYSYLQEKMPVLFSVLSRVNVPFRFLTMAVLFFCIFLLMFYPQFVKRVQKNTVLVLTCVMIVTGLSQSADYMYSILYNSLTSRYFDVTSLNTRDLMGDEYLYEGTDKGLLMTDREMHTQGCEAVLVSRNANRFTVSVSSTGPEAFVDLPVFAYPGYTAKDDAGNKLTVRRGNNHRATVDLPEGFAGNFYLKYSGLPSWHVCEAISALSLAGLIVYEVLRRKKGGKKADPEPKGSFREWLGLNLPALKKKETSGTPVKSPDSKPDAGPGKNLSRFALIVTSCTIVLVFAVIAFLNFHTGKISDDYMYRYFFDTGFPTETTHRFRIGELFSSMHNHRQIWNGRVVAHGLLQVVLMLPDPAVKVLNSLFFVLLSFLIWFHASCGRKKNAFLLLIIASGMWFFLPAFGQTVLWISGSASYLWCSIIILTVLLPYRLYYEDPDAGLRMSDRNTVFMALSGVLAGCTNENTGGAFVLLGLLYLALFRYKKVTIPPWSVSGIVGGFAGMTALLTAPGSRRIDSKTDLEGYITRFKEITKMAGQELGILLLILVLLALLFAFLCRDREKMALLPAAFVLSATASVFVLVFSAEYPARAMFFAAVLYISAGAFLYNEIARDMNVFIPAAAASCVLAGTAASCFYNIPCVLERYESVQRNIETIKQAARNGEELVEVPIEERSNNKYDAFDDVRYIYDDTESWVNQWIRLEYGISVKGYWDTAEAGN